MVKLENKVIVEILTKALVSIDNDNYYRGICYHIDVAIRDEAENIRKEIFDWFKTQKPRPRKHFEFTKADAFYGGNWWWFLDERGKVERKKFVNHLIKTLT